MTNPLSSVSSDALKPWPIARAHQWQQQHGWLVGCNFTPAYAINQLEFWQADTFDPEEIDRELGWAESLGFNSLRVYLHDLLWEQDAPGFLKRMETFLGIAERHHIGVLFVLFDSCWDPFPKIGKQREPTPHVHNSGWAQSPGQEILADLSRYDSLKPYVTVVLNHFRDDQRIHAWDLFNEPDNSNVSSYGDQELKEKPDQVFALLQKTFLWAREVNPSQPLTVGVWYGTWDDPSKFTPIQKLSLEQSDVISFHNYERPESLGARIAELRQWNRPLLCTEYMARPNGSHFNPNLGILKEQGVGAYNWGFVAGKSQTIYPWDSWKRTYTVEPPIWFHDIFRHDGTPYRAEEVSYIRELTGAISE